MIIGLVLFLAQSFAIHNGDLLFLHLDCVPLCGAIEDVTKRQFHVSGPDLSHVGVVAKEKEEWVVYEAWDGVQRTPLSTFLSRVKSKKDWHLARVKDPKTIGPALAFVRGQVGKPYDDDFIKDNGKFYCSELVADAFHFEYHPMFYGDPSNSNDASWKIWSEYFSKRNRSVPQNQPGVSPLGIWLDPKLIQVKKESVRK